MSNRQCAQCGDMLTGRQRRQGNRFCSPRCAGRWGARQRHQMQLIHRHGLLHEAER